MMSRRWLAAGLVTLSLAGFQGSSAALAMSAPAISDDLTGSVTQLTLVQDTQVPGKTLKSGDYTIRIVDHLSDRMIIRVEKNGKMQATFLAVPSSGLGKAGSGAIALGSGAGVKSALRGFAFPNGTTAEFVYPKLEAVGLAKANDTKIPAIDPASQGMKGNPSLSQTDREMVTLWLLSPTTVGPDAAAGIKAERYQAQQVASVSAPAAPAGSAAATRGECGPGGATSTAGCRRGCSGGTQDSACDEGSAAHGGDDAAGLAGGPLLAAGGRDVDGATPDRGN